MLVLPSKTPLQLAGKTIGHNGRFVDNFQRSTSLPHVPLGMGWQDLADLFPTAYDLTRIYNGSANSGDPHSRGKNGATMIPDNDWENYANYPGQAFGGVGGAIRNVGTGIYSYDVTTRITGVLHGIDGVESETTPIVGVNTASNLLGFGCWLVNIGSSATPIFAVLIGAVGNPPEDFLVTHTGAIAHTQGQQRDITLKYRGTTYTVWVDGVQLTNLTTYPGGVPIGSAPITLPVAHQNQSWAGFEYDQHLVDPAITATTPAVLSYSHQAIT